MYLCNALYIPLSLSSDGQNPAAVYFGGARGHLCLQRLSDTFWILVVRNLLNQQLSQNFLSQIIFFGQPWSEIAALVQRRTANIHFLYCLYTRMVANLPHWTTLTRNLSLSLDRICKKPVYKNKDCPKIVFLEPLSETFVSQQRWS